MTENREYQFKLLNEESAAEDLFEDKTHQKIADTLYDVIQSEKSEGVTIGIEGGWGSGKSTVVSILMKKLKMARDTVCFYFDAWAHEGDPLRRIFLEALIDEVGRDDEKLQEIKSRVSNRKKRSKTKSTHTTTGLGRWLALAAVFVPLGAALISGTASKTVFRWTGEINWIFWIGLICAAAPVFVIFINGWKVRNLNKGLFDPDNWMFLQGESKSTVTQEISEDEERSSIEFERYFGEILEIIFSKKEKSKLLIVVDNLDRIDAADSLKIWSTLQTFLQRRNPIDKGASYLKKIWILVPYDEEGLEKLWRDRASEKKNGSPKGDALEEKRNAINRDCAKSFFDKCFQLRIEVPKLILTGWESFCKANIDKALIGWEENEKNEVLNVLKWTRESVNDIPTPREIKTYVNQIGLLRLHCDKGISILAIAYFVVQKYLKFQRNKDIEEQLVSGNLPLDIHKPIFPMELAAELSGILFGVPAEKGQQLLLEPEIEKALNTRNTNLIKKMSEIHTNAFWTVLKIHLPNMNDFGKITNYSFTVWNGLRESYPDKCGEFVRYLKSTFDGLNSLEFPAQNNINDYVAMFSLLDVGGFDFSRIWGFLIHSLNEKMKKVDFDYSSGNKILSALASCQTNKISTPVTLEEIPVENWIKWAIASNAEETNSYVLVKPSNTIIEEIATKVMPSKPIPENLIDLIMYLVKGGKTQWQAVWKALKGHIESNQGAQSENVFSIEIFKIMSLLSSIGENLLNDIEPIVKNGSFLNLAYNLRKKGALNYAAFLLGKYHPDNYDLLQNPNVGSSGDTIQHIKNFWKTNNNENAQFVWSEINTNLDFSFIWKLAEKKDNLLVGDIIKIAIKEDNHDFFNYPNALNLFSAATSVIEDEDSFHMKLGKCFLDNSLIEKEILETSDLDIIAFSYELNLLIENTENERISEYLINKINSINKEQWDESLLNNTHLTALAVKVNKRNRNLHLGNTLYESLLSYLKSWIANTKTPSDAQKEELPELISILTSSFQIQIYNHLANYLINIGFKGNKDAISSLIEFINFKKIIAEGSGKIQDSVEEFINKPDIDSLKILDMILTHPDSSDFRPEAHLAEVFSASMKKLYNQEGIDKDLIERLAVKFSVDLNEPQQIEENSENMENPDANE